MLNISVAIPELERLERMLAHAPQIVGEEIRDGMQQAVLVAENEIKDRTPVDTGNLRGAITGEVEAGGLRGVVHSGGVKYARDVEEGTKPHIIRPKRAKALHFLHGGKDVFARRVRHPGTRGAHMFRDGAAAATPLIRRIFATRLQQALQRMR